MCLRAVIPQSVRNTSASSKWCNVAAQCSNILRVQIYVLLDLGSNTSTLRQPWQVQAQHEGASSFRTSWDAACAWHCTVLHCPNYKLRILTRGELFRKTLLLSFVSGDEQYIMYALCAHVLKSCNINVHSLQMPEAPDLRTALPYSSCLQVLKRLNQPFFPSSVTSKLDLECRTQQLNVRCTWDFIDVKIIDKPNKKKEPIQLQRRSELSKHWAFVNINSFD